MAQLPTLYHCRNSRSFRALWALEESEASYDLIVMPFPPRQTTSDFMALNPLGTVPLFIDGSVRMTESVAIAQYIAARYAPGRLIPEMDHPYYADYLNYCLFGEATLTFPQTIVLRYGRFEPEDRRLPQVASDYTRWFLARARGVDALLASREFAAGSSFSIADISVGYAIMLAHSVGIQDGLSSRILEYWSRLCERPAYHRALLAQGAVP